MNTVTVKFAGCQSDKRGIETMKQHSWSITHFIEQAKGCLNRKVDSQRLADMPHLRGTCHICVNYKAIKHLHRDSPVAYIHWHQHCANYKSKGG